VCQLILLGAFILKACVERDPYTHKRTSLPVRMRKVAKQAVIVTNQTANHQRCRASHIVESFALVFDVNAASKHFTSLQSHCSVSQ